MMNDQETDVNDVASRILRQALELLATGRAHAVSVSCEPGKPAAEIYGGNYSIGERFVEAVPAYLHVSVTEKNERLMMGGLLSFVLEKMRAAGCNEGSVKHIEYHLGRLLEETQDYIREVHRDT